MGLLALAAKVAFIHLCRIVIYVPIFFGLLTGRSLVHRRIVGAGDDAGLGAGNTIIVACFHTLSKLPCSVVFNGLGLGTARIVFVCHVLSPISERHPGSAAAVCC